MADGLFFKMRDDAIRETIGMQARTTLLSVAVIFFMPIVSAMKYMQGLKRTTAASVFRLFPFNLTFTILEINRRLMTKKATKNRHPRRANPVTLPVICFVKI